MTRSGRREGILRGLGIGVSGLVVLIGALCAGFGWLDVLRAHGALGGGPVLADSLPLRQLAGQSAQPLSRLVLAWVSVGLGAGLILGRLRRMSRTALLAPAALLLLLVASQAAYAVEETQNLASTLAHRRPGAGVVVEAALLMLGVAAIPHRQSPVERR